MGRLLGYVRPYRGRLTLAVVLLALVGLAEGVTCEVHNQQQAG